MFWTDNFFVVLQHNNPFFDQCSSRITYETWSIVGFFEIGKMLIDLENFFAEKRETFWKDGILKSNDGGRFHLPPPSMNHKYGLDLNWPYFF